MKSPVHCILYSVNKANVNDLHATKQAHRTTIALCRLLFMANIKLYYRMR